VKAIRFTLPLDGNIAVTEDLVAPFEAMAIGIRAGFPLGQKRVA
jgi:hypothetical protein